MEVFAVPFRCVVLVPPRVYSLKTFSDVEFRGTFWVIMNAEIFDSIFLLKKKKTFKRGQNAIRT